MTKKGNTMKITTHRNISEICKLAGQGLIEGVTYSILKMNIIDRGEFVESAAWVEVDGQLITVKNAHLAFGVTV
jgi:hypothetical protein